MLQPQALTCLKMLADLAHLLLHRWPAMYHRSVSRWYPADCGHALTCLLLPCSYGGFFAEPSFAAPGRGPPEDEDAFARRIWQEMEKRKRQQSGDAAAAARSYFSEQTKAEAARQQAAFDAAQHSRQILEEEKAKDRAWREAVLKVTFSVCMGCAMLLYLSLVHFLSLRLMLLVCSRVPGVVKFMLETVQLTLSGGNPLNMLQLPNVCGMCVEKQGKLASGPNAYDHVMKYTMHAICRVVWHTEGSVPRHINNICRVCTLSVTASASCLSSCSVSGFVCSLSSVSCIVPKHKCQYESARSAAVNTQTCCK